MRLCDVSTVRHFVFSAAFGRTWIDACCVTSKIMATAGTDEWTEAKCIQLIREFRNRPMLWDQKNAFFFKKPMKMSCWEEIGQILDLTADECKHKMNILTSSFRREKAKIMHSLLDGKGLGEVYQSTWFGFKDMAFLMDRDTERKRQLSREDSHNAKRSVKRPYLTLPLEPPASSSPSAKKLKASVGDRKQWAKVIAQKIQMENNGTQTQTKLGHQPSAGPSDRICSDEIGSFATFIANKMKKYNEKTKNAVQQAICEIIFKADQDESSSCENFTIIDEDNDPLDRLSNSSIKIEYDSDSD